jgi:hypothetical protein
MLRVREEGEVPPPQLDEEGNPIVVKEGSKSGTSKTPTLKSSRPRTRGLRQRARKPQHTPLQAKMTTSHMKRKSPRRGGREETSTISFLITLCPSITITCQILPLILPYPLARLSVLMR